MRPFAAILTETLTLLRPAGARYLALALVLMALYWYLGSPGPSLGGAPRTPEAAAATVAWAVLLLLAVPLVTMAARRDVPRSLLALWGDWRFGLSATVALGAVAIVVMAIGATMPAIQAAYPLPGAWAGASPLHLLGWTALYACYYVAFEFFYRGFMLRTLERLWGLGAALWMQTAASTLIHLGKPLSETLAAVPFGLVLGILAVRSRSLLWPILLHLVVGVATDVFSLAHRGLLWP